MSEETSRLTRREMRERGMLKAISSEDGPTPVEVLTQTSELRLRRPSRKELREQREKNAAREATQNAKFVEAEAKRKAEAEVEAKRKAEAEAAAKRRAEAEAAAKRKAEEEAAKRRAEAEAAAKRKAEEEAAKKQAEAEAAAKRRAEAAAQRRADSSAAHVGSGEPRRSVFDRFAKKADQRPEPEASLHDRLVARTKEGQREAREGQPAASATGSHRLNEAQTQATLAPLAGTDNAGHATQVDFDLFGEDTPRESTPRTETSRATRSHRRPVAKTPEAPSVAALAETAEHEAIDAEIPESGKSASMSVAGSSDSGFPTDVTMRIEDENAESGQNSTFVFWLIILIGLLAGLGAGLLARKVLWGMGLPGESLDGLAETAQLALAALF